jgi:hypothetical protein
MPNRQWFVQIDNESFGPLLTETLAQMVRLGRVAPWTLVKHDGQNEWTKLSAVSDFDLQGSLFLNNKARSGTGLFIVVPHTDPTHMRKFERAPIEGHAYILGFGAGEIMNISEGGLLIRWTDMRIPQGDELELLIDSKALGPAFRIHGRVIRYAKVNGVTGVAIEFRDIQGETQRNLEAFVKNSVFQLQAA